MAGDYQPMGVSMANLTTGYGIFLMMWGVAVSLISGSNSVTSFIPSIMGAPLIIAGVMTNKQPEKRKLWMHIAVVFGLLCALGGTRFFMVMSDGITYASGSMLMLFLTGSVYTYLCVKSFIHARKNRRIESTAETLDNKDQADTLDKKDNETTNIVQNITYNISDSVVSGGIDNNIENN